MTRGTKFDFNKEQTNKHHIKETCQPHKLGEEEKKTEKPKTKSVEDIA